MHTLETSFFWASCLKHCLAALDLGAGVEQPFDCLIVQNRQAMQSMERSMDWTLEDNMVDGLFFCTTLTGRRGGHTPIVQAGAETSDTGSAAVKPDPDSSWEGHSEGWVPVSRMKMRSLVGFSVHSAFHWWSAQCAARMVLLSDELMRSCAASTNGCLDLRRRAFALDGRVSAEWSRCPGSMAWRARDSVAPLRRSLAGWTPARTLKTTLGYGMASYGQPQTLGGQSRVQKIWIFA